MASKQKELALECKRQYENCLYTSTSLFIWLRCLRMVRITFVVLPLMLGSLGTWKVLTTASLESVKILVSLCSFLAGLLPAIYAALKFDTSLDCCRQLAGEFKNLQDRFRQAALISSQKPFTDFEADFQPLMKRLDAARSHSYTARNGASNEHKGIKAGAYSFDIDVRNDEP